MNGNTEAPEGREKRKRSVLLVYMDVYVNMYSEGRGIITIVVPEKKIVTCVGANSRIPVLSSLLPSLVGGTNKEGWRCLRAVSICLSYRYRLCVIGEQKEVRNSFSAGVHTLLFSKMDSCTWHFTNGGRGGLLCTFLSSNGFGN